MAVPWFRKLLRTKMVEDCTAEVRSSQDPGPEGAHKKHKGTH